MGNIISATVFTKRDISGGFWTEGYFLLEFRNAGYVPGGENFPFNTYMRTVQHILAQPANALSGVSAYRPEVNYSDLPANAGSARIMMTYVGSGFVLTSGIGISITSGTLLTTSGAAGLISGFAAVATLHSGAITASVNVAPGSGGFQAEVLSGVALSGMRAFAYVLGY